MLINVVMNAVAIALGFAVSGSYSVDVMSDIVLPDISVDVLADVNVNAFAGVMIAECAMPSPSAGFSC